MRRKYFAIVAFLAAVGMGVSPAFAEVSAMDRCAEVRNKLDPSFWTELRNAADKTVCYRPWAKRNVEFLACAATDVVGKFGSFLKVGWNAYFSKHNAEWAVLGPRYVGSEGERGSIQGGFKRTFLGAGFPSVKSHVNVTKRDGRAEGIITVCQISQDGNRILKTQRFTFANGNDNIGKQFETTFSNEEMATIGIVVDTPASINSFAYSVTLTDEGGIGGPKATGLADLHLHQLADLGFGGRVLMGEHRGPKSSALAPDQLSPGSENLSQVAGALAINIAAPFSPAAILTFPHLSIDSNILLTASRLPTGQLLTTLLSGQGANTPGRFVAGVVNSPNKKGVTSFANRDEDGFFQVAMPGGGSPDFTSWPHHADRGHQQAHIDWLKAAHDRGLNLVVVSLVHSPFLCNVFRLTDAYGNVAEQRDGSGKIARWASQNWNCDTQATINREIDAAQALDAEYDWYEIVMSPAHARYVIAQGKLAVVLSIESDGVLNNEFGHGDFEDELLKMRMRGVTTLQMVHERDSRFCGAAPHRDDLKFLQFLRYGVQETLTHPQSLFGKLANPENDGSPFSLLPNGRNRIGLKEDGVRLLTLMMDQGMPIDLAHMSVQCRNDVFAQIDQHGGGYGIFDSHTKFERMINPALPGNSEVRDRTGFVPAALDREKEFMITEDLLPAYQKHDVLLGLRTAAVDIYRAPPRADGKAGVPNTCPGSSRTYAQLVDYATAKGFSIAFGSDINGLIAQLGPRVGEGRCYAAFVPEGSPERATLQAGETGRTSRVAQPETAVGGREPGSGPGRADRVRDNSVSQGKQFQAAGELSRRAPALPRERSAVADGLLSGTPTMVGAPPKSPDFDGMNYARDGLATIAFLPALYDDLKSLRTPGVEVLGESAESYIKMWERAWARRK